MFKEFRKFITRGNVMDLAVGVIIGTAFTAIVNSLVSDLIMPLISLLTGGVDFSQMKYTLTNGASFNYGNFINAVIQFLLIALVVFLLVRSINKLHELADQIDGTAAEAAPAAPTCPFCLEEVKEGATRCPHCGEKLPAPAGADAKAK